MGTDLFKMGTVPGFTVFHECEQVKEIDMRLMISSGGIVDYRRPNQGISDLRKAGFASVCMESPVDIVSRLEGFQTETFVSLQDETFSETVRQTAAKGEIALLSAPCLRSATLGQLKKADAKACREALMERTLDTLALCEKAEIPALLVEPVSFGLTDAAEIEAFNTLFFIRLAAACRKKGTKILLTNGVTSVNGHYRRGFLSDGPRAARVLDDLNEQCRNRFAFCLDAGAASLSGQDMEDLAAALGSRIAAVRVSETDGKTEKRYLPFAAPVETDWTAFFRGLRTAGFDGDLILDGGATIGAVSPLIKPAILSFAKAVADYFVLQLELEQEVRKHEKLVLFGAGNMCRNFLLSYGDIVHPLFTVDNNKALWGTTFEGLAVKAPEELKNLPAGTAVCICNTYYREIEAQLQEMGITDYFFFNDEYPPVLPYERLKRGLIE